jgi:hypothetical protein
MLDSPQNDYARIRPEGRHQAIQTSTRHCQNAQWLQGLGGQSMTTEQVNEQLLDACLEALSLFNDYPECYHSIGTYQVLNIAINNALKAQQLEQAT